MTKEIEMTDIRETVARATRHAQRLDRHGGPRGQPDKQPGRGSVRDRIFICRSGEGGRGVSAAVPGRLAGFRRRRMWGILHFRTCSLMESEMTDLRKTVARAMKDSPAYSSFWEDGDYLIFADAAIAAMQPTIAQARREALEDAARIADDHARNAWRIADENEESSVCAEGRNQGALYIGLALRNLIEKEGQS